MKRRADERDGTRAGTVKAGKMAASGREKTCWPALPPAKPRRWRAFALGIRHVGESTAKTWPIAWASWTGAPRATGGRAGGVPDIGARGGRVHRRVFAEAGNQAEVDALLAAGVAPQQAAHPSALKLRPVCTGDPAGQAGHPRLTELRAGSCWRSCGFGAGGRPCPK